MSDSLNILVMLHDARRSGVPAVAATAVRHLRKLGVGVTVLFAYEGAYSQELRVEGTKVVSWGERTPLVWRLKRFLMNISLLVRHRDFDLVHIHSTRLSWSVLLACLVGCKVVFHLHEMPRRIGWLLRSAISRADAVVFCSRTCAEHFQGVHAKRVRTIVNAIAGHDLPAVRHNAANRRIVVLASINRNKGQDLVLNAFTQLKTRDAQLWLYGTTGLSARGYVRRLKAYARDAGISDRVFFPGPTQDAFSVFSEAAVVVHTSWTESFGMALVEAQSCGVPVIAHDLEGMREVVEDGITGFLIPPGDAQALAERLERLLADAELRNRMGAAGREMVVRKFTMEQRSDEYLQLYRDVSGS